MAETATTQAGLKVGLVVNPMAGIGGAVGLQGSDGEALQHEALRRHGKPRGSHRVGVFLEALNNQLGADTDQIAWLTWEGEMGAGLLQEANLLPRILGAAGQATTAKDTQVAVQTLCANHIDLLIFVGGDGTARDVLASVSPQTCVLGVPAGVKMHSGVFAISPNAAAEIVAGLVRGSLIGRIARDVRDYVASESPTAPRNAAVITKRYGELWVPEASGYLQQMKVGGREDEGLVVQEIVSYFLDNAEIYENKALVMGPGSTCFAIKQAMGLPGTLLGCDVRLPNGESLGNATSAQLVELAQHCPLHILVSFTRNQGFLLGRGNQQLSAELLSTLDLSRDLTVLGSRTKLASLQQRPMLVDTGDAELDQRLTGLVSVLTGFDEYLLYRVSNTLLPA